MLFTVSFRLFCNAVSKEGCNRIRHSSGKIEAAVTVSVTSVYLLVSKENQLKTQILLPIIVKCP